MVGLSSGIASVAIGEVSGECERFFSYAMVAVGLDISAVICMRCCKCVLAVVEVLVVRVWRMGLQADGAQCVVCETKAV